MAVAQILDKDLKYIDIRFIDNVTSKVRLGDGLEVKDDGKLHAVNADTQQNSKIEELESRIEELETYIDLLKQTYTIELSNGDQI
jgi:transcriptional antiterminator Rof (Rho-off)